MLHTCSQFFKDLFVNNLVLKEGSYPFFVPCVLFAIGAWAVPNIFWLCVVAACMHVSFFIFFFRNPERHSPQAQADPLLLVAPCDGKVLAIERCHNATDGYTHKISIFLSPLDVHVNWMPMQATVQEVVYHRGSFYPAFLPKASELNERNDVVLIEGRRRIMLRQITGTLARTIVCWVQPNQRVQAGQLYGMMKFGSRIDFFVPDDVVIKVQVGQYVWGGITIIGRWVI